MGCDRISELPDCLLAQILSCLPTKDSVKTSILSTRWRFVWLMVHEWIRQAVDRGIQQLDVVSDTTLRFLYMPWHIYRSNTLVSIKLVNSAIENPEFVVSLPCLKVMHLEDVWYEDERIMENLLSGCPVLEKLTVIRVNDHGDIMYSLRVRSQSLKRFLLTFEDSDTPYAISGTDYSVEVDAPRLEYMRFKDNHSDKIVIKNLTSLHTVEIDTEFNNGFGGSRLVPEDVRKRDTICNFLNGVSRVSHITISHRTLEVLCLYSKLGPIPKFVNVCRMQVVFPCCVLQFLPLFLESFPNLKNLNLDFIDSRKAKQIVFNIVPKCLSSTLEYVRINKMVMSKESGIRLANYFLENSALLKNLTLNIEGSSINTKQEAEDYKKLLTSTKRSSRCQIFCSYRHRSYIDFGSALIQDEA
ncbi:unnamed protein product [Cochlearia groenlandica]